MQQFMRPIFELAFIKTYDQRIVLGTFNGRHAVCPIETFSAFGTVTMGNIRLSGTADAAATDATATDAAATDATATDAAATTETTQQ